MQKYDNDLEKYRQKRIFNKTTEPEGKVEDHRGPHIFVIQKHQASHLHYDLRLEINGVLKSWAIPKGPTLIPGEKRLAMMVEDHPFGYKDFEGIIPEGNYGAGIVMVWDNGSYHAANSNDPKQSEEELNKGLDKGHVSFILEGKKLNGEFALVKLKRSKSQNAWLLIKANDYGASSEDITKYDKSVFTSRSMEEIKNDSKRLWGSNSGEIDLTKAPKKEIVSEIKPMLATLIDKSFNDKNWIFEIKWDGYRAIAIKNKDQTRLLTRNNKLLNDKFPTIIESIEKLPGNFVLDGEIVVLDKDGKPNFNFIQNYKNGKGGILVYYVFDILYLGNNFLEMLSLSERKEILSKFLDNRANIKKSDFIYENGIAFFDLAKKQGLEGIIAKNKNSVYQEGVRSKDWLKIKSHLMQEAVIGGFTEPEKGRRFLGGLLLGVYQNQDLFYIGSVGSGFTDQNLKFIKDKLLPLKKDSSPFVNLSKAKNTTWVKPNLVCQIKFQEWTDDSIRQPVFLGLREDVDPRQVIRETAKNINIGGEK